MAHISCCSELLRNFLFVIRVNDNLLFAAGFPRLQNTLEARGYKIIELEMSEFQQMDGGLSCLSLRFVRRRAEHFVCRLKCPHENNRRSAFHVIFRRYGVWVRPDACGCSGCGRKTDIIPAACHKTNGTAGPDDIDIGRETSPI